MGDSIKYPRHTNESNCSFEDKEAPKKKATSSALRKRSLKILFTNSDSAKKTGQITPLYKVSMKGKGLIYVKQKDSTTYFKDRLESQLKKKPEETINSHSKASIGVKHNWLEVTILTHPGTIQTCTGNKTFGDVIDGLVGYQNNPKESLYCVC